MARLIKMEIKEFNPPLTDVESYHHRVEHQTDANRALYAGMRIHQPVRIVKTIDKQSPQIFSAMVQNKVLKEVTFTFYRSEQTAAGKEFYKVKLQNVHVESVEQNSELGNKEPNETVEFKFTSITETIIDGGVEHTDEWKPPSAGS